MIAPGPGAAPDCPGTIAIVTDAWLPQVNGVVRTLRATAGALEALGHRIVMVTPERFRTVACPTYPDIRLALAPRGLVALLDAATPDAIHIATEGPLGLAARAYCLRRRVPFTTAYHTRFPEYLEARTRVPARWTYPLLRWFHRPARRVMVATASLERELAARGFARLCRWSRGVDTTLFRPRPKPELGLPRPIFLTVGRVAVEKNLPAFLDLDLPGSRVVVGDGPQLDLLRARYPTVHFAGRQEGESLAGFYAAADAFVFPSRTDTFGLVLLEALASGLPVAAYPVTGPLDVLDPQGAADPPGILDHDLRSAALAALAIPSWRCRAHALRYSWEASARQFVENLAPFRAPA